MRKNVSMSEDKAIKATDSIKPYSKMTKDILLRKNEIM